MIFRVIYVSQKTMEAELGTVRDEIIRAKDKEAAEVRFNEIVDNYDHIVKIENLMEE